MRIVIIPGLTELRIKINPTKRVNRKGAAYIVMPWMYAPWPDAKEKGVIEIEVNGKTLRALLAELSARYKRASVDFQPINPRTNDIDFDYDIVINAQNYVGLPNGLDTKIKGGDELTIKMNWRWDG
jgi:molybdopterin converting factor small subunit